MGQGATVELAVAVAGCRGNVALTVTVTGISGATMAHALLDPIGIDDPAVRCLRRRFHRMSCRCPDLALPAWTSGVREIGWSAAIPAPEGRTGLLES